MITIIIIIIRMLKTFSQPAHAVTTLGMITDCHVLPQRDGGACVEGLFDVHPRGMYLVVECEPPADGDTRSVQRDRPATRSVNDHLPIRAIQEHARVFFL